MKILIAGATGLIGKKLGIALVEKGHRVIAISRDSEKAREHLPFPCQILRGDLSAGVLDSDLLHDSIEVVVNLVGESVGGGRWTERRKRGIYNSRILGTRNLIESLRFPPKVFINASATGYYGSQGDQELTEESPPGDDFLSQVCQDWEEELVAMSCNEALASTRVVSLRTAMVLNREEGAMTKLLPLFQRNLGSPLADGQQWMSWIHWSDAVRMIVHAIENSTVRGPMNVTAPKPATNSDFTAALARAMDVAVAPNVPGFVLKGMLGEMSALVLNSQRVLPTKALQTGFKFKYPTLQSAFEDLFPPHVRGEEVFCVEQYLPWKPQKLFPFFANARNLESLTPPILQFKILGNPPDPLHEGVEIDYRLKIHGVPASWKTLIKKWDPPNSFVDVQLNGPYRVWEHTHEFLPLAEGTLMRDHVRYRLPLGAIGGLIAGAFVRKDLRKIFEFRRHYLATELAHQIST